MQKSALTMMGILTIANHRFLSVVPVLPERKQCAPTVSPTMVTSEHDVYPLVVPLRG